MNEAGTLTRGWFGTLRRRSEMPPVGPAADPAWMTGVSAQAAALAAEGRDEGWIVSSWELRRGLQVSEGASPESLLRLAALWSEACRGGSAGACDIELPLASSSASAQAPASSSRRNAAPSSITAIA
jgi:hypothetical protein